MVVMCNNNGVIMCNVIMAFNENNIIMANNVNNENNEK
jgi:hypothetical protein